MKLEKEIHVHINPHGKKRISTKGRIHPNAVKYIRSDIAESQIKKEIVKQTLIFCERSPATALMEGFDIVLLGRRAKTYSELRDKAKELLEE